LFSDILYSESQESQNKKELIKGTYEIEIFDSFTEEEAFHPIFS